MRRRSFALLLALLFGLAIAALSVAPINRIAVGTRTGYAATADAVLHAAFLHLVVHVFIFAAAAIVFWVAASVVGGFTTRLLGIISTFLLGWGTEYLQHARFGQPIELNDVLTNTLSSGVTFLALALFARYRTLRTSRRML